MNLKKGSYYAAIHRDLNTPSYGLYLGKTPGGKPLWCGSSFSWDNCALQEYPAEEFEFCEIPSSVWNSGEGSVLDWLRNNWLE